MARFFDGSDDVIEIPDTTSIRAPTTAITLATIFRVDSTSGEAYGSILHKKQTATNVSYAIQQEGTNVGVFNFGISSTGSQETTAATSALTASTWYLAVGRWTSGSPMTLRIYNMDGSINQTVSSAGSPSITIGYDTNPLFFAQHENLGNWRGDIAVAGVWGRSLSDAEAVNLIWSLSAWYSAAPNGLWLLDQSATTQNVPDLTGGGANQSAITGTSVSTNSVPGFGYGADLFEVLTAAAAAAAPVLVPARPRTAHRRVAWRRRGDQVTPVPAQVTPPPPPSLVQTPGRHLLRGLLWRRGRTAAVPAPQAVPPPRIRPHRTFTGRPRRAAPAPVPPQVAPPAPPPYPVTAWRPRRIVTGLRRAKTVTPVPPQVAPTPPPKYPLWPARVHRTLLARWRSKTAIPVPEQAIVPPGDLTYIFRPPTTEGPRIPPMIEAGHFPTGGPRARLGAFTHGTPVGITVLKEGGVFVEVTNPSSDRLAAAQRVYMGGYEHTVTGQDALDLIAAGYMLIPM